MVEKRDYIDITPAGIDDEGKGSKGKNFTVFQETEWRHILDNPSRLTKEGCEASIALWRRSSNAHVIMKYQTMLARCTRFTESGKDDSGNVVFSRFEEGSPRWVDFKTKRPTSKAFEKKKELESKEKETEKEEVEESSDDVLKR